MQVDLLLGGLAGVPGWALAGMMLLGLLLGFALSKVASSYLNKQVDQQVAALENAELRAKVCKQGPGACKGGRRSDLCAVHTLNTPLIVCLV